MTTIISGYTRENRPPQFRHRLNQSVPYLPELAVEDAYTTLGEPGQLVVNAAYMDYMEDGEFVPKDYTGLTQRRTIINKTSSKVNSNASRVIVADCGGSLTGAVILNSADRSQDDVLYGGMHYSFTYKFNWKNMPLIDDITASVCTHRPYYKGWDNLGGDQAIILNLVTTDGNYRMGIVTRLYGLNHNQRLTQERIVGFDPNSGKLHVTNHLGCENKYITRADESDCTNHSRGDKLFSNRYPRVFNNFFKVHLTADKFIKLLEDAAAPEYFSKYTSIDDWRLLATTMQYELHNSGEGIIGAAHSGFRVTQGEQNV